MKKNVAKMTALGGMMAALAVVLMSLGGMIPLSTYICPMLCIIMLQFVLETCGNRIAWAWYGAVALLCLLFGPDKEAVAVFIFLGNYPMVKQKLDKMLLDRLLKAIYFNASILLMYWLLMNLLGMTELIQEFEELGMFMTIFTLILGNVTFFMLDVVLSRFHLRRKYG